MPACAELCKVNFNCNYFDFEKNNGQQCFLKRAIGLFTDVNWTKTNISCGFISARIYNVEFIIQQQQAQSTTNYDATTATTTPTTVSIPIDFEYDILE